jgi:hypothetical protein
MILYNLNGLHTNKTVHESSANFILSFQSFCSGFYGRLPLERLARPELRPRAPPRPENMLHTIERRGTSSLGSRPDLLTGETRYPASMGHVIRRKWPDKD